MFPSHAHSNTSAPHEFCKQPCKIQYMHNTTACTLSFISNNAKSSSSSTQRWVLLHLCISNSRRRKKRNSQLLCDFLSQNPAQSGNASYFPLQEFLRKQRGYLFSPYWNIYRCLLNSCWGWSPEPPALTLS